MVRYSVLKGFYETEKTIGCGGFAKVKLATHLATGEKVAIKIMDKRLLGDDLHRVNLELEALKNLNHENICQLYQVMETESHFFIVMEYCSGGELFDHIVEKNRLTEAESRTFFRQIVSAVAYLHSLGYAHRDLKPENVLLDRNQILKLIDFGLCAKPEGGMENPLFTSCGSPTYAAPELILGQQYLGQEVDVWAMGVLLFALLTGSLPFDDLDITNLYRKILNGKYDEPPFISKESKKLIRSMLQVEPKKRIKVSQLLDHPWLTMGVLEPVNYNANHTEQLNRECVQVMANFLDVDENCMKNELIKRKYDYSTATYLLLLARKNRGQCLKLNSTCNWKSLKNDDGVITPLSELPVNHHTPSHQIKMSRKFGRATKSPGCLTPSPMAVAYHGEAYSPSDPFLEPRLATRKALKRPRSPFLDEASPVPSKKVTPGKEAPSRTPNTRKRINSTTNTPGSARRMLGSIERSLHKVRHVLTPKRPLDSISFSPSVLHNKDLCNVSTAQCKDPELVITELSRGLEKKGIICTRKGFTLKGSLEPSTLNRFGGCSFELEICYLPNLGLPVFTAGQQHLTPTKSIPKQGIFSKEVTQDKFHPTDNIQGGLVGIRRKRLRGNSWCYKKVCEQVLALTSAVFEGVNKEGLLESSM